MTNREIGVTKCGLTQQQIITLHELNNLLKRETHWEHYYLGILCERIKYQRVSIVVEHQKNNGNITQRLKILIGL